MRKYRIKTSNNALRAIGEAIYSHRKNLLFLVYGARAVYPQGLRMRLYTRAFQWSHVLLEMGNKDTLRNVYKKVVNKTNNIRYS